MKLYFLTGTIIFLSLLSGCAEHHGQSQNSAGNATSVPANNTNSQKSPANTAAKIISPLTY